MLVRLKRLQSGARKTAATGSSTTTALAPAATASWTKTVAIRLSTRNRHKDTARWHMTAVTADLRDLNFGAGREFGFRQTGLQANGARNHSDHPTEENSNIVSLAKCKFTGEHVFWRPDEFRSTATLGASLAESVRVVTVIGAVS